MKRFPTNSDIEMNAEPPAERSPARIGTPVRFAGGIEAVKETARYAFSRMGPVHAVRALLRVNKRDGFDCQSCAWPNPNGPRHIAEFCENGAKAISDEGTKRKIGREFFARYSVEELARKPDHWLNAQGRLVEPMVLREGEKHYEPIEWEEAFALLARELNGLDHPREAIFYTSGRTSNEAAFLYQLFVRSYGSNNLPDCSNMCHESSGAAMSAALGIGKGTVTLEDLEQADAIFIAGQNPGTNHPRMLTTLQNALRRGCKIVTVNPLDETWSRGFVNPQDFKNPLKALPALCGKSTALKSLHLAVRINGDLACFRGIIKEMLEEEERRPGSVFDLAFLETHTHGVEQFLESVRATSWTSILQGSGLTLTQIREAANVAMTSERIICCWAMGLTQHVNAVDTIREVINFLLLRGNVGKAGAGPCPVRGHSNVQGDRTMGICENMSDEFLDRLGAEFSFEPPRWRGTNTVEAIHAMADGSARIFFAMGGNFLSAAPDTAYTAAALRRCHLTAHVSTKLNRAHLVHGRLALILPCLGRSEVDIQNAGPQFVTVEDSMGIINRSRGSFAPASPRLLSEPAIIARLAKATLGNQSSVPWADLAADYDLIRDRIERVIPGFEGFTPRIRKDSFYLPNAVRDSRIFKTLTGRANFHASLLMEPQNEDGDGRFLMMTIRSHDQFNTTIYGLNDRYRGIYSGRRVVFMNPEDVEGAGLTAGQFVDLVNRHGGVERRAEHFQVAPYEIPRGCTATYFPEANALVPIGSVAAVSNTPASKSVFIEVIPSSNPAYALQKLRDKF